MDTSSFARTQIPNPALQQMEKYIGEWTTVGMHPGVPDKTLMGISTIRRIEGGAFMIWHSAILNDDRFPAGISIFGSDNDTGEYFILYFDEREISRRYTLTVTDNELHWSRINPAFSQRNTWTISPDGNTIVGKGEMSKDGKQWEKDLDLTFTRVQ
jgi:hypothetical protein